MRAKGKQWEKVSGNIVKGAYVQDILEGRLNQPKGRGAIGKVVSMETSEDGIPCAVVDFGREYSVPIKLSELALVRIVEGPR